MGKSFVHLHTHSHYSLLDGLTRIEGLVTAAKRDGQPALALTDHGALYGTIEFYRTATKAGIKPILGIEAYYAPDGRTQRTQAATKRTNHLILLAKNAAGYANLLSLASLAHLEGFYYKPRIDWELLDRHGEGLIVLSGCLGGELAQAILHGQEGQDTSIIRRFRDRFGEDYFLELQHRSDSDAQRAVNTRLRELATTLSVGIVATNDVHYLHMDDAEAHDVLLCLQTKTKQTDQDRLSMLGENYSFRTSKEMRLLFEEYPEAIENTLRIAERCAVKLELGTTQLPSYPIPRDSTYDAELAQLCSERFAFRYGSASPERQQEARERLTYELEVVRTMGYSSYFLIVQDFVNWAKHQGIVVGPGRGSAAGSIVSYICGITNIDPLAYDLLFERFLTPGRIQMPDIDLDFADHRRDEVIAYVKEKYGEDHVAQIITFGTMAARASIRDVGRVLDVPYTFCDRLAKLIPFGDTLEEAERDVGELRDLLAADDTTRHLFDTAKRLEGIARHTSTHACGVVIAARPLVEHLPIQRASADDATIVTQYEMHAVEELGLLKMDFLGLSNLSIIEDAVRLIQAAGVQIDIDALPLDDRETFALLQRGETTGVFQLESGGMKRYLKELKPSAFEDIIAMVSLYRPGPMELIPEYIDRKFSRKPVTYLHPKLEPILKNTYGIMVYQEQLMRLARDLAGFTLSEADTLRKAVGKKIKKLLDEQKQKLVDGMIQNGIHEKIARNIWEWIEPFARYGFNRSHAACYAMIAYQTAYLKAHEPAVFMCALLTSERGSTDRLAVLIQECRDMRLEVLGPDVNESDVVFAVVNHRGTHAIRFGLAAVKNVGEHLVEALVAERKTHGPYRDLADLLGRVQDKDFNKKSLESLIRAGALDQFGDRGTLLANIDGMLAFHRAVSRDAAVGQESLFGGSAGRSALRITTADPVPLRLQLAWEKELLGLYLSAHPFATSSAVLGGGLTSVAALRTQQPGAVVVFGGVITRVKRIVTKGGDGMLFAEVEDATGSIEAVVFPRVLTATSQAWIAETAVLVRGKLSDRDAVPKVLVDHVVQIAPGREADALRAVGGLTPTVPYESQAPFVLRLPPSFSPAKLEALRSVLASYVGTLGVVLRSANGRTIQTGMHVTDTPAFRAAVEELLGDGAIVEAHDRPPVEVV